MYYTLTYSINQGLSFYGYLSRIKLIYGDFFNNLIAEGAMNKKEKKEFIVGFLAFLCLTVLTMGTTICYTIQGKFHLAFGGLVTIVMIINLLLTLAATTDKHFNKFRMLKAKKNRYCKILRY